MKRFVTSILATLGLVGSRPSEAAPDEPQLVLVRIPVQLQPLDRGAKYEDPLDAALKKEAVGEVNGGSTELSAPDADGKKSIEWVEVDVDLSDFERGMPILKRELLRLGAPPGTILEYSRDGQELEDAATIAADKS
jgi:hypothetical protein